VPFKLCLSSGELQIGLYLHENEMCLKKVVEARLSWTTLAC